MRQILRWIVIAISTATLGVEVAQANEIEFKKISLRPVEQTWVLDADLSLQLTPALEQLVNKGVVLHFVTEFQLTQSRWYWFDAKTIEVQRVSKISYQALTNQYRVTLGSFSLSAANLKQVVKIGPSSRRKRSQLLNAVPGSITCYNERRVSAFLRTTRTEFIYSIRCTGLQQRRNLLKKNYNAGLYASTRSRLQSNM